MIMSKYKFNKFLIIPIIRKSVFKYNFSFSPFFILYLKKSFFICFCSRLLDKFLSFDKKNKFFLFSLNRNFRNFNSADVTIARQNQKNITFF